MGVFQPCSQDGDIILEGRGGVKKMVMGEEGVAALHLEHVGWLEATG